MQSKKAIPVGVSPQQGGRSIHCRTALQTQVLTARLRSTGRCAPWRCRACQKAAEASTDADPVYVPKLSNSPPNARLNNLCMGLKAQVYFRSISDLFAGCGRPFARAFVTQLLTPPCEGNAWCSRSLITKTYQGSRLAHAGIRPFALT